MEHRRVDIHGHLYQWVDFVCWEAVVARGGGSLLHAGMSFASLKEALDWIQDKPHFMLIERTCIRAYKIPSVVSDGNVSGVPDTGEKYPQKP